ncbi:11085_t:CDS:2 [Gigaspora margarita]|uniref:11085_t:CDS:1 n=1 Tax=Gigaspora margarita TaxID=4874 RepID=A0ABN7UQ13_GIGMA|nr:11085_t:CDS:2 [Gigaspora margarita]
MSMGCCCETEISLPVGLGNIGQTTSGLEMFLPEVNSLIISAQIFSKF